MGDADDLRKLLRSLIGTASSLDGLLVEAQLPDLEIAKAKVEAADLVAKLEALADRLGAYATMPTGTKGVG
jgi:hypothetical protein